MASGNPICISSSPPSAHQPSSIPTTAVVCTRRSSVSTLGTLPSPSTFLDTRRLEPVCHDQRFAIPPSNIGPGLTIASAPQYDGQAGNTCGAIAQPLAIPLAPLELDAPAVPPKRTRRQRRKPKSDSFILNSQETESTNTKQAHSVALFPAEIHAKDPPNGPERAAWAGWASALEKPNAEPSGAQNRNPLPAASPNPAQDKDSRSCAAAVEQDDSAAPVVPLSEMLSNFAYIDDKSISGCTEPIHASTKRRKIELANASTVSDLAKKSRKKAAEQATSTTKTAKKSRSPKKKAQTITALAMAPYQPSGKDVLGQSAALQIFPSNPAPVSKRDSMTETLPAQIKKSRKPRAKPSDLTEKAGEAKKSTKAKKGKITAGEADPALKLYSPKRACEQIGQQDFLFGTSSQLLVDESPAFIKDMQSAVAESEMVLDSIPRDAQLKSPVGTSEASRNVALTVARAGRALWSSASRDFNGGILRDDSGLSRSRAMARAMLVSAISPTAKQSDAGICVESMTAGIVSNPDTEGPQVKEVGAGARSETVQLEKVDQDSWALLSSSSPALPDEIVPQAANVNSASLLPSHEPLYPLNAPSEQQSMVAERPPSPHRKALEVLDANVKTAIESPSKKQSHPTKIMHNPSSVAAAGDPTMKRPVGRPRKMHNINDSDILGTLPPVKRKRGRPPKNSSTVSVVRVIPEPELVLPTTKSRTSPAPKSGSWANIDEITDDEVPNTPSPRRQRADPTLFVEPLQLSPYSAVDTRRGNNNKHTLPRTSVKLRWTDEQWPAIYAKLAPQITSTIKSIPRSADPENPNWLQKILLYDPIVLEDLTAWLNDQHITIAVERLVKEVAPKGRKKKKNSDDLPGEENPAPKSAIFSEPLQTWMVQKWCEENSICCLWREGLRGGVRARY